MFKIKDKVLLGALSAVLATTGLNIVDLASVLLGTNKWHIWQIAGSLYFKTESLKTIPALFIGAMTHTSIMGLAGVVICYVLYFTGRDHYLVKGFGILMIFWIFLFGIILRLGIARIEPLDPGTNLSHYVGHATAGLMIRLGNEYLIYLSPYKLKKAAIAAF